MCWITRHRSVKEWFLDAKGVHAQSGHTRLATHIWEKVLQPWLIPYSPANEPQRGSYFRTYALDHLREANKFSEIETIVVQRPWQQAMLEEKGRLLLTDEINKALPIASDMKDKVFFQLANSQGGDGTRKYELLHQVILSNLVIYILLSKYSCCHSSF
jgi:hypothetical protein